MKKRTTKQSWQIKLLLLNGWGVCEELPYQGKVRMARKVEHLTEVIEIDRRGNRRYIVEV